VSKEEAPKKISHRAPQWATPQIRWVRFY